MASMTVTGKGSGAWFKIAFAMFAVGWGANQFSPMLIVYRHALGLGADAVAGLFLVYALTLIPGLLVGGPASDRFGRRPVVWPFVALSPLATLLLVLGPRSLVMIAMSRALAGLCSGVVFGAVTAYYALAYLGFAAPYLVDGLGALVGQSGAFAVLTAIIAGLALWTAGYAASLRRSFPCPEGDICQVVARRAQYCVTMR
jgi:MFS family permease